METLPAFFLPYGGACLARVPSTPTGAVRSRTARTVYVARTILVRAARTTTRVHCAPRTLRAYVARTMRVRSTRTMTAYATRTRGGTPLPYTPVPPRKHPRRSHQYFYARRLFCRRGTRTRRSCYHRVMDSARVPVAAAPTNGTSARGPTREPDVEHDTAARDSGAPTTVTSPRGSVADSTSGDRGSTSSRSTAIGRPVYDVIERARYEDIAMRLVMQESLEQIASALDLDVTNVRRIIKRPGFRAVYEDVHRKVYDDLSGLIKNEKAAPLLRLNAKSIRVQTMLGEIIEEVRKRVETGKARSMDLKVGVEAAFGILDRTGHGTAGRNGRGTNVVNITFNQGTAEIFKNATQEAGLDLSDLRDYIDVEAVPVETEETTDDDNGEPEP